MNRFLTALAAMAALPMAQAAQATTITYGSYGYVGENVHITDTSPPAGLGGPHDLFSIYAGAGPITLHTSSGPIVAFCVDIFTWLQPSGAYTEIVPAISAADPNFLVDASALIANGLGGTPGVSAAEAGAAVQVAIWDLEYNGLATPLSGPLHITGDDPSLNTLVTNDIAHLSSSWAPGGGITELFVPSGNQDLITLTPGGVISNSLPPSVPVPEPASLALLGTALLGLELARRGFRGRSAQAK